ncbi:hypothetical protein, partial [Escherichia coli]|uniref:hypothetical protein n=1 Tax=Escherichia coli TaxID=562 RepID=UPI0024E0A68F
SGEKRVFLVILFTSFSGSLVSRISGAVQNGSAFRGFLYDVLTTIQPAVACRFSSNGLALRKFCLFCLEGFNDIATTNNKGAGRKTAD